MFPRLAYLEWITGRPDVALYDLATSDMRGDRDHEPEIVPEPLEGLDDPPTGATLETQIAGEYGVHPEQVLVTAGASVANFVAIAAALYPDVDAADADATPPTALVEKPTYEPLLKTPRAVGGDVDRFIRQDEFRLDADRVAKAMAEDTHLVTVTNRHNPSGRLADRETLSEVAAVADDHDAKLLVDEVYAAYTADPLDGPFGGPTAADLDGAVVTNSFTKFHGLSDVRIGWIVADRTFVQRARSIAYHIPGVSGPGRALGKRVFHNSDELDERSRQLVSTNADLLSAFVESRDDVEGVLAPDSTFAFLDPVNVDGDELAESAWEEGVLVVPGRFFGDDERIRVSLGRSPDHVATALDALGAVLDGFQ
ncbi:pyridoxal phosphate-dependent aminotransferase [Halobacterium wangiae]|uniref:pyridoxal phosphate-dependent aminotransferase n=1 Tax=Halobacterium wangiae TaxID=2902623 RepID=UPI001E6206DE|nr:pyridoxal phosphate-dependent aminotransferase [Halobacterium wangiae]